MDTGDAKCGSQSIFVEKGCVDVYQCLACVFSKWLVDGELLTIEETGKKLDGKGAL